MLGKIARLMPFRIPYSMRLRVGMARRKRRPRYLVEPLLEVEKEVLRRKFEERLGYSPDLEAPRTFNEKVQWRKLFDRRAILTVFADKYGVRDWVASKIGSDYLTPLLHVAPSAAELPLETISRPFMVKPSHASGVAIPVRSNEWVDLRHLRRELQTSLDAPYGLLDVEWAYSQVEPRALAERLLVDDHGRLPSDFKIHCFGGEAVYIQVHTDRFTDRHATIFYDRDWLPINLTSGRHAPGRPIQKPDRLSEILEVAEELAADMDYIRVDLYHLNDRVIFGEMTIYPGSGFLRWSPEGWDGEWGSLWRLPTPSR